MSSIAWYRDDAGKEHAWHFERKVDAQKWLDEQTASLVAVDLAEEARGLLSNLTAEGAVRAEREGPFELPGTERHPSTDGECY